MTNGFYVFFHQLLLSLSWIHIASKFPPKLQNSLAGIFISSCNFYDLQQRAFGPDLATCFQIFRMLVLCLLDDVV